MPPAQLTRAVEQIAGKVVRRQTHLGDAVGGAGQRVTQADAAECDARILGIEVAIVIVALLTCVGAKAIYSRLPSE